MAIDLAAALPASGGGGGGGDSSTKTLNTELHGLSDVHIGKVIYFDETGKPQLYHYYPSDADPIGATVVGVLVSVPNNTSVEIAVNYALVKKQDGEVWTAADLSGVPDLIVLTSSPSTAVIEEGGEIRKPLEGDRSQQGLGRVVEPSPAESDYALVYIGATR